jgi:type IV pilus assembly protein PilZ
VQADIQGKTISVKYADKNAMYQSYMPFCRDGGIFVPLQMSVHLGTPLFMYVELPSEKSGERNVHTVWGRVSWIGHGNKKRGVGVRLTPDESGKKLKTAIENLLAGSIKSNNPTHTM